jgi:hypothetical protein
MRLKGRLCVIHFVLAPTLSQVPNIGRKLWLVEGKCMHLRLGAGRHSHMKLRLEAYWPPSQANESHLSVQKKPTSEHCHTLPDFVYTWICPS